VLEEYQDLKCLLSVLHTARLALVVIELGRIIYVAGGDLPFKTHWKLLVAGLSMLALLKLLERYFLKPSVSEHPTNMTR
jgi:hypothetical protein